MSDFDRELTGILSRNDRKEKDTHADFKGSATINAASRAYCANAIKALSLLSFQQRRPTCLP